MVNRGRTCGNVIIVSLPRLQVAGHPEAAGRSLAWEAKFPAQFAMYQMRNGGAACLDLQRDSLTWSYTSTRDETRSVAQAP